MPCGRSSILIKSRQAVGSCRDLCLSGKDSHRRPEASVIDARTSLYIFLAVLILGTLWRVSQFHLMASPNPSLQHLGKAMSVQY